MILEEVMYQYMFMYEPVGKTDLISVVFSR